MTSADLATAMERALRERSPDAAWAHLAPFHSRVTEDRDVAHAWAALLQASPSREGALSDARAIVERFGAEDPALGAAAITAMIRVDERRAPDELIGPGEVPAQIAEREAKRLLDGLDAAAKGDPDRAGALWIARANALRRLGAKHDAEAIAAFEHAISTFGARGEWLFDLGLAHKWAGRFRAALVAFQKARELLGDRRGVLGNIAISAMGADESAIASEALRAMGVAVESADQRPFVSGLAPVQVRIPTRGPGHGLGAAVPDEAVSFERIWAQPLSPCHGVLRSPTLREAIADWGDVVLWDLAPAAFATEGERRVPVFPLLAVLHEGGEKRLRFLALEQHEGQMRAIGEKLPEGVVAYEHGVRVEQLCARCAAGDLLTKHEHEPPTEHRAVFGKILVPADRDLAEVRAALETASRAEPGVLLAVPSLFEALGDTALAGKHHKTWGVIERGLAARAR